MGLDWETLLVPEMLGQTQGSPIATRAWPRDDPIPRRVAGVADDGGQGAWHVGLAPPLQLTVQRRTGQRGAAFYPRPSVGRTAHRPPPTNRVQRGPPTAVSSRGAESQDAHADLAGASSQEPGRGLGSASSASR